MFIVRTLVFRLLGLVFISALLMGSVPAQVIPGGGNPDRVDAIFTPPKASEPPSRTLLFDGSPPPVKDMPFRGSKPGPGKDPTTDNPSKNPPKAPVPTFSFGGLSRSSIPPVFAQAEVLDDLWSLVKKVDPNLKRAAADRLADEKHEGNRYGFYIHILAKRLDSLKKKAVKP